MFAWKIATFSAMVYLFFLTAYALTNLVPACPFLIVFAWKIAAFAAVVYLSFFATYTEVNVVTATLEKAIVGVIPATFAHWVSFHHRLGAFIFFDPSFVPIPRNQ